MNHPTEHYETLCDLFYAYGLTLPNWYSLPAGLRSSLATEQDTLAILASDESALPVLYDSVPASHQLGVPKSPDRDPDMIRVKRNARNNALIDIAIVRGDNSATGLNLTTAEAYRLTKLLTHVIIETSQQQAT